MKLSRVFVLLYMAGNMLYSYGVEFDMRDILPDDLPTYSAKADVFISMPIANEDVNYTAKIVSLPSRDDKKHLCASDYLIEIGDSLGNKSVYSYFDGNYFAYSGGKLREYHYECDSLLFKDREVKGKILPGIHKSGMVSALVPVILSESLKSNMCHLSCGGDTLINGQAATIIKAVDYHKTVEIKRMEIALRKTDCRLLYCKLISNPGTLTEQIVIIHFEEYEDFCRKIDKNLLMARYPDVFKE